MTEPLGYLHPRYAESLVEFGLPRHLEASQGWLLDRPIPGSDAVDAMGCYPLFAAARWDRLSEDLDALIGQLVSVTVVTDPFGEYTPDLLARTFDVVRPFKTHTVVDSSHFEPSRHHRRRTAAALRRLEVAEIEDPPSFIDEWCRLYEVLIRRHNLRGLKAFSRAAFEAQLRVPGLRVFRAAASGRTVGAHLWYVAEGVAYSHLHAISEEGYTMRASYALYQQGLDRLAASADFADLGGAAGPDDAVGDGLGRFKRGWSSASRTAYLCGRILEPDRYRQLTELRQAAASSYFPAYRDREFLAGTPRESS